MQRIETFFLEGPAGRLECMLKRPAAPSAADDGPPAAAVVCHPHPLFGGTMHNKVVHAAAEALVDAGFPVLRFNFRGVGKSGGRHDGGRGEQDDLRRALDGLAARFPGRPHLIAGYSFGAWVALRVGCEDPRAAALIGIGLPLTMLDFSFLRDCRKPLAILQGESDPFAPEGLLLTFAALLPGGARVSVVPGAAHDFAGRLEALAARVLQAVPDDLQPGPPR